MSDRTKSERKAFLSIGDELDNAAEQVARRKGIPTLTPPSALETPKGHFVPGASNDRPAPTDQVHGKVPATPAATESGITAAKRSSRASYVKVKCPDYLLDQLYEHIHKERVTLNHLILTALRERGFRIDDADMVEDGRRLRGRLAQPEHQDQR